MRRVVGLWLSTILVVCSGETTSDPIEPELTPAAIRVSTTTTGVDLDPDGYRLFLDDQLYQRRMGVNDTATLSDPTPGEHTVRLTNIEANCSVADNPRMISVTANHTVMISFVGTCVGVADSAGITTTDLGPMLGARGWTIATSLADDGSVAGWAEFGSRIHAFHRSTGGSWTDLNAVAEQALGRSFSSLAWGLSENLGIVGITDINTRGQRPILWRHRAGGWEVVHLPVDHPNGPARGGSARAINPRGDVVAGTTLLDCGEAFCTPEAPVIWSEVDGNWQIEFLPFDGTTQGIPAAVNDADPMQVAGHIDNERAVVWTRLVDGWRVDVLPTPPGYGATVKGMNQNGDIAGEIFPGRLQDCAATTPAAWFRSGLSWELIEITGRNFTCDGVLPNGFATDVSDSRAVVGAFTLSGQRAFIWRNGTLQLLRAGSVAWAINEVGQFAGAGIEYSHAMLWATQQ
jgi:uncharacterized membrane protein